ncbi:MAG: 30S ribosomal protein S9 [Parcubacteria group bacterium CG08_land_8_20_14_0_20_43_9]|nr:MAG: 30S ribosomal protein S9 [Parcubacteria group bacterium CG08_land_8_20_14_0_20_43_9]
MPKKAEPKTKKKVKKAAVLVKAPVRKKTPQKAVKAGVESLPEKVVTGEKYVEAVGRRKTAVARVRLFVAKDKPEFLVNNKNCELYFSSPGLQRMILSALEMMNLVDKFGVSVRVAGGGKNAQAEAVRHGISRALIKFNPDFRKRLKKAGFLTRDPRMRERKKFGLKRARRGPQWSKR